ncbi:unnamed protein product [Aphanomyces euteiches]|uniref:EVE domain-containing protein n=1 Tax=Aphanomyces euteiches TaxID=100861 RepID=A0A6G0WU45_9STRA|nr:hypothetical protein Ae201684_011573 [Aphanomyces euteiches]KAH9097072.1 hypothetical protein Ae201684P_011801 [Aphanomyces euteiches]KAH9101226.1 hypothetical protein LEN26_015822 [Aphanomyces euteiches]KAH9107580.1 hypothetical protein AeMF1_017124 [Aphanomyces euteiches]KAH9143547.1 hypothetical protein AeRB84_012465 [Aphanomyces euteiches]
MPRRYWIGVVSKNHVERGVAGGFAQVCHGKSTQLRRMADGDYLIYYSPKTDIKSGDAVQAFTAIGRVNGGGIYQVEMTPTFHPFRTNIDYNKTAKVAPIKPLLSSLSFIKDAKNWGHIFRRGHFEIPRDDFERIVQAMAVNPIE